MKRLFLKKSTASHIQEKPLPSLGLCIAMDAIGCVSYIVPVLGEVIDFVWAPVSAGIYMKMFGFRKGLFGGVFQFVEELLPGFDIIPTFTITWFMEYSKRKKQVTNYYPVVK